MPDFGFVNGAYEAPSIYQDAQELINWYCEIDMQKPAGERGVIALYPTPGFAAPLVRPEIAEVRALYTLSGGQYLIAVVGTGVYFMNGTFTANKLGALNSGSGPVGISDNGLQVMIVDGANRYSYTLATGVFTGLDAADGAWVGGSCVDAVDNFLIYNKPGSQEWAATTALSTATNPLSFSSKDGAPDNLVRLFVVSREVFLLGETTAEVWIDVGTFPFPFSRIAGTSAQHGCAAEYSVSRLGESMAWVSRDSRGQGVIVIATGYTSKRISTHAVENTLVGQKISDARAFTYQMEGHEFYVCTFPSIDLTWVYDLSTNRWHKWLSVDALNVFHRARANCACLFQGQTLVGDFENGAIYALDNAIYAENGAEIRRVRRCPHLVRDLKRGFFQQLQIQFQPGVGLDGIAQGTDPQAMLRWSDDGGSTWGNEHWTSIGKMGQYKNRAIWRQLGFARDRIFEVAITDPVRPVIISANLIASSGAH